MTQAIATNNQLHLSELTGQVDAVLTGSGKIQSNASHRSETPMKKAPVTMSPARLAVLTSMDRDIFEENRQLLERRWQLATTDALDNVKDLERFFPGQRELLDVLSVMDIEQVRVMADCGTPLFKINLPATPVDVPYVAPEGKLDQIEEDCARETFIALLGRLDALRQGPVLARQVFDLSTSQSRFLERRSPREMQAMAHDPNLTLRPAVNMDYFFAAASHDLTTRERTALSMTARRLASA